VKHARRGPGTPAVSRPEAAAQDDRRWELQGPDGKGRGDGERWRVLPATECEGTAALWRLATQSCNLAAKYLLSAYQILARDNSAEQVAFLLRESAAPNNIK